MENLKDFYTNGTEVVRAASSQMGVTVHGQSELSFTTILGLYKRESEKTH